MLKVTTRYLASTFIPPFILGLIFFVSFLITFFMFRLIGLIVTKGVDVMVVISMVANLGISFFPLATPLAAFFATFYTLNKLSEDSEIIAMRSFGLTKIRIYLPFLMISLLISLTITSLYSVLIPKADAAFNNTIVRLTSAGMLASIKAGQFFTDIPNVMLYAKNVSNDGNTFNKVFIHIVDKNKLHQRIIFARSGTLIKIYADHGLAPSLRLHLNGGSIVKMDERGTQLDKIVFKEYDFPVFNSEGAMTLVHYDTMKTNFELLKKIDKARIDYNDAVADKKNADEILERKKTIYKTQTELFARYVALPQILLFMFLGFSLGIKRSRGDSGNNSSKAIIIIMGYYAVYFFMLSLARDAALNPLMAVFAPSLLFFLIALRFYKKLDLIV
ncbi:MAG: LptF/LptG family permease [Bacteriovorax sp.]